MNSVRLEFSDFFLRFLGTFVSRKQFPTVAFADLNLATDVWHGLLYVIDDQPGVLK